MRLLGVLAATLTAYLTTVPSAHAQSQTQLAPADPARSAVLRPPPTSRLSEQFIWTANDAAAHNPAVQARVRGQDDKTEPHFFRVHFRVATVPREATLYLAGPRSVTAFLNGQRVLTATDDGTRPKNLSVLTAPVAAALHPGNNVLALAEVRGHSSLHTGASPTINQVTYGEVLAVKIVPAALAVDAPPLLISDTRWHSTLHPAPSPASTAWQQPTFDDSAWPLVESLGILGSKRDFLQWNADAGLYAWPGYHGISADLRVFDVIPSRNLATGNGVFDFTHELSGRLRLTSTADTPIEVIASYGESLEEAQKGKGYLGPRSIVVPPHGSAYGPKTAFRYVTLQPGAHPSSLDPLTISAEAITFPVQYLGSFDSSDRLLNRIWETAAYTAHLCLQEGIWDGVKRDRGRWMGDLDVTGRTLSAVFASPAVNALQAHTMADIIGPAPVTRDINTITGYSALWITGQADFFRHTGDLASLRSLQPQLLSLLALMDTELSPAGLFTNPDHHKVFVDWSHDLSADTPEARAATHFEFLLAYAEAAFLLDQLGDREHAAHVRAQAARLSAAAQSSLLNPTTNTFGARFQTNALAILSGAPTATQQASIWTAVLAHLNTAPASPDTVVTPYHGYYVLSAMAALDHRAEALDWMRTYWGGMLAEGATSFWEAYDPHWPKADFHASLEADGKRGYYVSLAHGWASGPAAWLAEQILGIHPTAAGFREVIVRPDLAGLTFVRGAEPTPRGPLGIDLTATRLTVTLPAGTRATVQLPFNSEPTHIRLNGHTLATSTPVANHRLQITLTHSGTYRFQVD